MILDAIAALHPNALVAWDRDVMIEIPSGIEVYAWDVPVWVTSCDVKHPIAHNGIGCVIDPSKLKFRAVLHLAPNDLGVAWFVAEGV